jgi:hypothetical protein
LFEGFSKLLICGGYYRFTGTGSNTCEVIDLESSASTCKNPPNFPETVYEAIGGLGFKKNPIICGGLQNGYFSKRCYSLENNEWVSFVSMNSERYAAAAAQLQDGKLLVTGSYDGSSLSVEMLTEEGWESNIPSFPVAIQDHCMITVNLTTVMAIGLWQNGDNYSGKTFYFTFGEENWTEGPELKYKRRAHSCGRIRRDKDSQEMSIIVAGGYVDDDGSSYLSSVEILNEGSNEWQTGPELPFGIYDSQMVKDHNGGVVLIGGVSSLSIFGLDTLFQLSHGGQDAVWTKMEQRLKTVRGSHTAILVPANLVDCS